MEYDINIAKLNKSKLSNPETVLKLRNIAQKAERLASKQIQGLQNLSKEMQIVHKYLELASYKERERFNAVEILEILGYMSMYKSKIPAIDLVKQLLNIGVEKGVPLSSKEMKDFLATTAFLNKDEQINVIKFVKSFKETIPANIDKTIECKTDKKLDLISYKAYTSKCGAEPEGISKFINLNNMEFVFGVTRCEKPDILAKIVKEIDTGWGISVIPNDLVKIYEISNGNIDLVEDLVRGFYPWEIDEIVSNLSKNSSVNLSKYKKQISATDYVTLTFSSPGISVLRESVLDKLGLTGQIKLSELDYPKKIKVVDGSFEQGKRR